MRFLRILVVAATLALAVVAQSGAALSPGAYRAQANAVCAKTTAHLKAIAPTSGVGLARYLERAVSIGRGELAALRKLDPPASLRETHMRALRYIDLELDLLDTAVKRVHAGADPAAALRAIGKKGTQLGNAEQAVWREARVKACAD